MKVILKRDRSKLPPTPKLDSDHRSYAQGKNPKAQLLARVVIINNYE